jgi:hypothetical protein
MNETEIIMWSEISQTQKIGLETWLKVVEQSPSKFVALNSNLSTTKKKKKKSRFKKIKKEDNCSRASASKAWGHKLKSQYCKKKK